MQVVEVSIRPGLQCAYRWDGDKPLTVGERVVVPAAPHTPMAAHIQWVGPVVALESNYDGPLTAIVGRA